MAFSLDVLSLDEEKVKQEVTQEAKLKDEEADQIRKQAETNAVAIMDCDLDSIVERKQFVKSIEDFGLDTMKKSSSKSSLMQVSVGNMTQKGGETGEVSRGLVDLNREIKNLDPSAIDFTKRGLLGKITNPIRTYFERYQKAEGVIANIIDSLENGKKTLTNDNTTLLIEQTALRDLSKRLNKETEMAITMDQIITEKLEIARSQNDDPDKIRFVEEEILFPLRQRTMDMQQMIVLNHQGVIAMEVIQRNNKELIRGVERAKTVTVTALRTAVMVANALYNQKIVLKKIQAINETTNSMIAATSKMLKEQGTEIHKQAAETNISVDVLKTAFGDVLEALDEISAFKQKALPVMQTTISQFRELADQGEAAIEKIEKGNTVNN